MATTAQSLKCKYCGKEDFDKQGKLNLHQYHCGLKKFRGEYIGQAPKAKPEACEHKFRLLNTRIPQEYNAHISGYEEVCTKCQDLQ